jgi:hypothetical protein
MTFGITMIVYGDSKTEKLMQRPSLEPLLYVIIVSESSCWARSIHDIPACLKIAQLQMP